MDDKVRSLYIDMPSWEPGIETDDFLVAVGKKQSNSVYHVANVKSVVKRPKRLKRYYLEVYKTDLITMLNRDRIMQDLVIIKWYPRNKKKK